MLNKSTKIFYWSPFLGKVATIRAVLNSAISLKKYSKNKFDVSIINCFSEWDEFSEILKKNLINKVELNQDFKINTNITGFIKSRLIYFISFFKLYLKLKKLIKKNEPDYLIIHLITFIPLILFFINKFNTKLILRISGKPELNYLRKFLWKIVSNKIYKITCPTLETLEYLKKNKIFSEKKLFFLPDPAININEIIQKKKITINKFDTFKSKDYFINIGRFTEQKNQLFLINEFKNNSIKENLLFVGSGELKNVMIKKIDEFGLNSNIKILDYQKNVFNLIRNSKGVIVTSKWEDPGFIMIEAAAVGIPIICSDCPSGPKEFISNKECGYLFSLKEKNSFFDKFNQFNIDNIENINKKILKAKRKSKIYTKFNHFKILSEKIFI